MDSNSVVVAFDRTTSKADPNAKGGQRTESLDMQNVGTSKVVNEKKTDEGRTNSLQEFREGKLDFG